MQSVWLIGGTRPEALKLAPVFVALRGYPVKPVLVSTGQHPRMFHEGLRVFGLSPDLELPLVRESGSPAEAVAGMLEALDRQIVKERPDAVLVQGDTSSALAAALAAFWRRVPVAHLEAGLRSHTMAAPFPEESNRQLISRIAGLHLAPTHMAAQNLRSEGIGDTSIEVVGNTIVDSLTWVAERDYPMANRSLKEFIGRQSASIRVMLVTMHRRELWGQPMCGVLDAVQELVEDIEDLVVVLPTHPNPEVADLITRRLPRNRRILVTPPLDYVDFISVLKRSAVVLTDSGGVQEEAPSFGVPVVVLRDVTERTEGIDLGIAALAGTDPRQIVQLAMQFLNRNARSPGLKQNPYGTGRASGLAASAVADWLGLGDS